MEPVVESSASAQPAPEPTRIDAQAALDAMTPAQHDKWRATGELPSTVEVVSEATPAPAAKPASEDAPAVDAKGQPVTGKDGKPLSIRQQKQNEIIRRGVEEGIATERARAESLERELRDLKARTTPPAAERPAAEPAKAAADPDAEPVLDDFLDQPDPFVAHAKALGRWAARQELNARDTASRQRTDAERAHQSVIDRVSAHQQRETALKATVPDYDAKTLPIQQQMVLNSPLTLAVLESSVSARLVLHFAEHPADFQRIGRLGVDNFPAALREIGRLEAQYDTTRAPAPEAVAPKHVSDAPDPAPVLGSRPAEPGDPVEGAIRRKDPGEYIRAANARELAAARK